MSENQANPKRSRIKLVTLIAVPLIVIAGGLTYAHQAGGGHHGKHREHRMEMHLDHMNKMLVKIGASDAQKSQIDGIMREAFTTLSSVRESHDVAGRQFHEILLSPSIDRSRIEALRAEQVRSIDEASKRLVIAFGDAAEVLSPEQRAAFAREIHEHHGG